MRTFIEFAVLGLGLGALYALVALGVVIVYRVSGVINFAIGAVGMVGVYLYWELHDQRHWSFIQALVPALLLSAAVGYLVQALLLKRLQYATPLVRLLATIGVLISIQSAIELRYPGQAKVVSSSLPTGSFDVWGMSIGKDRSIILAVVVVLVVGLAAMYRWTKFGIATTAVADDIMVSESLGRSASRVAAYNWAIASALAALAGILLAPITGLSVVQLTNLLIPALAAAVIGRMVSFPVTLAAALLIGIVESEVSWYVHTPGWAGAAPFLIIIAVLAVRGQTIPGRATERAKLPAVGRGRISVPAVVIAFLLSLVWLSVAPTDWVNGTGVTVAFGIILLSLVVVTGYAGQLSLAQYALAGMGAFVAGRLTATQGWPFLAVLLAGMVAAIPVGIIVGLPAVRTRGSQLAVATLGLAVAIEGLVFNNYNWTGGGDGTTIGLPEVFGLPVDAIFHPRLYVVLTIVVFTTIALGVANLRRSRTGRRLLATRTNERAAMSLGVNIVSAKLYAFVIGSMIAAAGGVMLSYRSMSIIYADFTPFASITLLGNAVVGGIGFILGPIFGATLQPASLGSNMGYLMLGDGFQKYLPLLTGLILVYIVARQPDGMASHAAHRMARLGKLVRRSLGKVLRIPARRTTVSAKVWTGPVAESRRRGPRGARLTVDAVTVAFGSVKALSSVSLEVNAGRVLGLIGPNGAGKTTLIDAVTGFNRPSTGEVRIDGGSLARLSPRRRAAMGMSRSFQALELFEDMTVLENLLVASEHQSFRHYVTDLFFPRQPRLSQAGRDAVEEFDLVDDLDRLPSDLPYGKRRLVAIARAIAAEPDFLLLDEPAAGLSDRERGELVELIRALAEQRGIGVLLVEHDVDLVMRACDEIVVLDFGRVIAQGEPADIRRDPAVIAAYLGEPVEVVGGTESNLLDELTKAEALS